MELVGLGDLEGAVGEDKVCHRRRRHSIVYLLLLFVVHACLYPLFLCAVVFEFSVACAE